jgi:hypothetical protein
MPSGRVTIPQIINDVTSAAAQPSILGHPQALSRWNEPAACSSAKTKGTSSHPVTGCVHEFHPASAMAPCSRKRALRPNRNPGTIKRRSYANLEQSIVIRPGARQHGWPKCKDAIMLVVLVPPGSLLDSLAPARQNFVRDREDALARMWP